MPALYPPNTILSSVSRSVTIRSAPLILNARRKTKQFPPRTQSRSNSPSLVRSSSDLPKYSRKSISVGLSPIDFSLSASSKTLLFRSSGLTASAALCMTAVRRPSPKSLSSSSGLLPFRNDDKYNLVLMIIPAQSEPVISQLCLKGLERKSTDINPKSKVPRNKS